MEELEEAKTKKNRELHPDFGGDANQLMKIHHVYSNYLENSKVKQVYDIFSSVDRPLYPKIMTAQFKNLVIFHERANQLGELLNKFIQEYKLDMSLLKKELDLIIEILTELIKSIDPEFLKPEGIPVSLDDLLMLFILLNHFKKGSGEESNEKK